jgi:predicted nuclease of predicted toxin-antitoxin system
MNLLADESVDRQIVERLRRDGHDVLYVAEMEPGITDVVVLERANEKVALLITADKDFGEIIFQEGRLAAGGVVLIRLAGLSAERKAEVVSPAFSEHGAEFQNSFSVISPGKVRIRAEGDV